MALIILFIKFINHFYLFLDLVNIWVYEFSDKNAFTEPKLKEVEDKHKILVLPFRAYSDSETPRLDGSVVLKLWISVLAPTSRICLTGRGGKVMPSRLY